MTTLHQASSDAVSFKAGSTAGEQKGWTPTPQLSSLGGGLWGKSTAPSREKKKESYDSRVAQCPSLVFSTSERLRLSSLSKAGI